MFKTYLKIITEGLKEPTGKISYTYGKYQIEMAIKDSFSEQHRKSAFNNIFKILKKLKAKDFDIRKYKKDNLFCIDIILKMPYNSLDTFLHVTMMQEGSTIGSGLIRGESNGFFYNSRSFFLVAKV